MRATSYSALAAMTLLAACNQIAGIAPASQRPDDATTDDASGEASSPDASSPDAEDVSERDARSDAGPTTACTTFADCPAGKGYSMCTSLGQCRKVTALARGMCVHECAILDDGSVVCWGNNDASQLGTGSATRDPHLVGTPEAPLPPVQQLTLGINFTCALTSAGDVYCWGLSPSGGNTRGPKLVNIPRGSSVVVSVSSSGPGVCALLADGRIYCWGTNVYGELGCRGLAVDPAGGYCESAAGAKVIAPPSATTDRPMMLADGTERYSSIAMGLYASCAEIQHSGQIPCWGNKIFGNVGDGTTSPRDWCCGSSTLVAGHLPGLQRLVSSDFYTCWQDVLGDWSCWGYNTFGTIEASPTSVFASPHYVGNDDKGGPRDLSPGWRHMCWTLKFSGGVRCQGDNEYGAIGDGTQANVARRATDVQGLTPTARIVDLAAHRHFTCALQDDGQVMCWGADDTGGLLGVGDLSRNVTTATAVNFGTP